MVHRDASWAKIKELVAAGKTVSYVSKPCRYILYVFSEGYQHECHLFRSMFPVVSDVTKEQNDLNVAEFEADYKSSAQEI